MRSDHFLAVAAAIRAHPEAFDQTRFRTPDRVTMADTGGGCYCVAGWAAALLDRDARGPLEDDPDGAETGEEPVARAARKHLGLSPAEGERLFSAGWPGVWWKRARLEPTPRALASARPEDGGATMVPAAADAAGVLEAMAAAGAVW